MNKTLYVSDLDETLLGSNERISAYTASTINDLIGRGMIFSFATARSYTTASEVTRGLSPRLPVITYNGTFIVDGETKQNLHSEVFTEQDTARIISVLARHGLSPMVRTLQDGGERVTYLKNHVTRGIQKYLDRRVGDKRLYPTDDEQELLRKNAFCFTCMDEKEKLAPALEELREHFRCLFFVDVYTDEHWLEIQPTAATKANAVLTLKALLGCDRVVCFGNGINDISMFKVADECYAVANAAPELKAIATDVILSNDDDGVAKWLSEHFER